MYYSCFNYCCSISAVICFAKSVCCLSSSPIAVKNTIFLGPQCSSDVTNVSRDGGYSLLINGSIVWLYDDTECTNSQGSQLSFVSNTAATAIQPNQNISLIQDYGVVMVGQGSKGELDYAILANTTVGTGGWIPFLSDELEFNQQNKPRERIAICRAIY